MRSFGWVVGLGLGLVACGGGTLDPELFGDSGSDGSLVDGTTGDGSTTDGATDGSVTDVAIDTGPTCVGLECQIAKCDSGTTTLSGVVYDPAGLRPIPNVAVYVPNGTPAAIADGLTCSACMAPITGKPLSVVTTNAKGAFTLTNVPVGANIPLVMQLGKWRRAVTIPTVTACVDNPIADKNLTRLPKNKAEGNLPLIALAAGCDQLECFLVNQIGIDPAEITSAGGAGRVHAYRGHNMVATGQGYPAGSTDAYALWGNLTTMKNYDLLLNACECSPDVRDTMGPAYTNMKSYLEAGGRMIGEHYHYNWFASQQQCANDPSCKGPVDFNGVAAWGATQQTAPPEKVDTTHPRGQALADWLIVTGGSTVPGDVALSDLRNDVGAVKAPTTRWLYGPTSGTSTYTLSFNTPLGSNAQCGRAVFVDTHAGGTYSNPSAAWPASCNGNPQTNNKNSALALEYAFFDSFGCVQDDTKPTVIPPTQ